MYLTFQLLFNHQKSHSQTEKPLYGHGYTSNIHFLLFTNRRRLVISQQLLPVGYELPSGRPLRGRAMTAVFVPETTLAFPPSGGRWGVRRRRKGQDLSSGLVPGWDFFGVLRRREIQSSIWSSHRTFFPLLENPKPSDRHKAHFEPSHLCHSFLEIGC